MRNKTKRQTALKSLSAAKTILPILAVLLCFSSVRAQEKESEIDISASNPFRNYKNLPADSRAEEFPGRKIEFKLNNPLFAEERERVFLPMIEDESDRRVPEKDDDERDAEDVPDTKNLFQTKDKEKFHWKPALIQSGVLLALQHGWRLATQPGTRRELRGPFFRDWGRSVKNLRGWNDGNRFFINYIGHPLQGGVTGQIFINNSDRAKKQEFGKSKDYWDSRFKAMIWSAIWSAQFELGPISEANIGNVGLNRRGKYSTMAYVDLVVTPVIGTAVVVGEDAIDKYVFKNWLEKKSGGALTGRIKILRSFLMPATSITNLLRGKKPWYRNNR